MGKRCINTLIFLICISKIHIVEVPAEKNIRVIPREIAQKSVILTPSSSSSAKIYEPIVPHERNMYAQF